MFRSDDGREEAVRARAQVVLGAALLVAVGCSGATQGGGQARRRNVITAEEIATIEVATAYHVVRRLRPQWLQARGAGDPVVYIDQQRRGRPGELEFLLPADVAGMRYLNAGDATLRWGTNHPAGAIMVTLKR